MVFFVPQSCSAKWSSRAEARCVREAWTLQLFPILLRRTQTHPTSHHPQLLQQGGKVKSLMISPALLLILLLFLIHLKLVDRIALWYVFEEMKSSATNWFKSPYYILSFSAQRCQSYLTRITLTRKFLQKQSAPGQHRCLCIILNNIVIAIIFVRLY